MANVIEETRQLHNDIKTAIIDMGGSLGECSSPKDYPDAIRSIPSIGGNYVTREELEAALKNVSTCNCSDEKFIKILNDWWDEKQNSGSTDEDYLRLSVKELEVFSDLGESKTVTVTSTNRFSYQVSHSWINVSVSNQTVTISCPKYTGTEERTGSISFYIGNKLYETLVVKQHSAIERTEESTSNIGLEISKSTIKVYSGEPNSSRTIAVSINPGYTFDIQTSGNISVERNGNNIIVADSEEDADGIVTVTCNEDKSITKTITVKITKKASDAASSDKDDFFVYGRTGYPNLWGDDVRIWGLPNSRTSYTIRRGDGNNYSNNNSDSFLLSSGCAWLARIDKIYSDEIVEGKDPETYLNIDGTLFDTMSGDSGEYTIGINKCTNTYPGNIKVDVGFYTNNLELLKTVTFIIMRQYGLMYSVAASGIGDVNPIWMREGCNPFYESLAGTEIGVYPEEYTSSKQMRFHIPSLGDYKFTYIPEWAEVTNINSGKKISVGDTDVADAYFRVNVKKDYFDKLPTDLSKITVELVESPNEYVISELSLAVIGAQNDIQLIGKRY